MVVGWVAVIDGTAEGDGAIVSEGDSDIVSVKELVGLTADSVGVADGSIVSVGAADCDIVAVMSAVATLEESWAELMRKAWLTASTHRRREAPDTMATCRERTIVQGKYPIASNEDDLIVWLPGPPPWFSTARHLCCRTLLSNSSNSQY